MNLDNSPSTGAGAVLYSNRGADALGRLLVVNQANPANPQQAVRIQNAGVSHALSIFHDPAGGAGDSSAEAVDIVSTNPLDTTLGVEGQEGRGTVKITHEKPVRGDANAAAISIALLGAGTACQGIFIGNDAGNPQPARSQHPQRWAWNGAARADRRWENAVARTGTDRWPCDRNGRHLFRLAQGVLATDGGIAIGDALVLTSVDKIVANGIYNVAHVTPATTIAIGEAGALRGFGVEAKVSTSGVLAPSSLSMFNLGSIVTPSAQTKMNAVEVYKSSPQINGLPGVADGVSGSMFSSFKHQLRLRPIDKGTASFARVFGFYMPPALNSVGAGWTVPNYSAVRIEPPGGTGAITNLCGIDIRDFDGRGAYNYSLRSTGSAVQMRHSGAVSIGAQAAADTVLHLRGNASAHGALTIESESADPPLPVRERGAAVRQGGQARDPMERWRERALHDDPARQPRPLPRESGSDNGHHASLDGRASGKSAPQSFTLELSLDEMGFLRLLLTNATVQPAVLKKLCGEVQGKIEAQIGPLPLP